MKTGGRFIRHARYFNAQPAESYLTLHRFEESIAHRATREFRYLSGTSGRKEQQGSNDVARKWERPMESPPAGGHRSLAVRSAVLSHVRGGK